VPQGAAGAAWRRHEAASCLSLSHSFACCRVNQNENCRGDSGLAKIGLFYRRAQVELTEVNFASASAGFRGFLRRRPASEESSKSVRIQSVAPARKVRRAIIARRRRKA